MQGTMKEYLGEPARQMNYTFFNTLVHARESERLGLTMGPAREAAWVLRRAYTIPDSEMPIFEDMLRRLEVVRQ